MNYTELNLPELLEDQLAGIHADLRWVPVDGQPMYADTRIQLLRKQIIAELERVYQEGYGVGMNTGLWSGRSA